MNLLTSVFIRRFKRFYDVEIELGNPVVFIGPNNSGKTSALQALALWSIGVRKWSERRESGKASKRTGVSINRRELLSIPLLRSHTLWRDLRVRTANTPLRIEIKVQGVFQGQAWECGMEFETVDQDNIRCRPITLEDTPYRVPDGARQARVAFLPPMSGLISQEDLLQPGSIERRIGEGRTSDVLRNLCYRVFQSEAHHWQRLTEQVKDLFGVKLLDPEYDSETGVLSLEYAEESGIRLDLNSSGQGFRQTLLLLAYLYTNSSTILLLDEPDAHLELLRQRQIYQTLTQAAEVLQNQIIIATHSEVILNDAAGRDLVIAFVGKPHKVTKSAQVRRALADYGFEHYAQAEQTGFVLYLEGSTDLAILKALAERLNHPAQNALRAPFVHYVANQPPKVLEHFHALREAFPQMVGLAIFDRLEKGLPDEQGVPWRMWARRELENYIVTPRALAAYAEGGIPDDLFGQPERARRQTLIESLIRERVPPIALNNPHHAWWINTKMSDDFLDDLFEQYFLELKLPNTLRKSDYHQLCSVLDPSEIDSEIITNLDLIENAHQRGQMVRQNWIQSDTMPKDNDDVANDSTE